MKHTQWQGFTLLEVLLAVIIVALLSASLGPVLINTLKAQQQAYAVLEPLAEVNNCFKQLQDDLLSAPRPNGTHAMPCVLEQAQIQAASADYFAFTSAEYIPLHPALVQREAALGQVGIQWSVISSPEGRGLAWLRSRQTHLMATGTPAQAVGEVMMDNLAYLDVEFLSNGNYLQTFHSDDAGALLPVALIIKFARLDQHGVAGPERVRIIHLAQVSLDPIQLAGG